MIRPLILVTPDVTIRQSVGVDYRHYDLKANYTDAVTAAGGLPLVAPYTDDAGLLDTLVKLAHGLLLTGGDFDVDPRLFGARPHPKLGTIKPERTAFERALFARAQQLDLPTLGICGGMQLMNVERGGTLWQDLPDERPGPVAHSQKHDRRHPGHEVHLSDGLTMAAFGQPLLRVNSSHHQAIRDLGKGVRVTGSSEDGLAEVIELDGMTFSVGVQWHPETMLPSESDPRPLAIYEALVKAADAYRTSRG